MSHVRNSPFQPRSGPEAWIDDPLEALAADDAQVRVPARIQGAVLREWDQHLARFGQRRGARDRRARLAWVVVPAAAAVLLAVAVVHRDSLRVATPEAVPAAYIDSVDVPPITRERDPLLEESRRGIPVTAPAAVSPSLPAGAEALPGYVIVPEPLVDPGGLHVVRARMSRIALATLGVPIVSPDLDGLVEVEMLVGDDGVAQSIRHAALVNEQWDAGRER
jgi:hypothetical protein